jgi:PHP domain
MAHGHDHGHSHAARGEVEGGDGSLPAALDLSIPDGELSLSQVDRRSSLRRAGLLGAAAAGAGVLSGFGAGSAAAAPWAGGAGGGDPQQLLWLVGDHHIHTGHSPDGQYLVSQQVSRSAQYGLDWMVITDHGGVEHQKFGVETSHPEIVQARKDNGGTLVFQGLEWNIPAAEHGTVFVAPGDGDVALLKEFEGSYDGT